MIQKRCFRALNKIKFLCGTWWGAHRSILMLIFKSFVRSIIEYGIYIYLPKQKKIADKLEKIQYQAIRTALGYRSSTPTNILLAESKLIFITDRARYLCNRYLSKIFANDQTPSYKTINKYHFFAECTDQRKKRFIEAA